MCGRKTKEIRPMGEATEYSYAANGLLKSATDYSYNVASWLTGIDTVGPQGAILSRAYSFDGVGNIESQQSERGPYHYGYDATYQLTSAEGLSQPTADNVSRPVGRLVSGLTSKPVSIDLRINFLSSHSAMAFGA
ncbi:MAG: hypothetical protein IBX47_05685 [Desulfuromonadales bacterium]|nr:hypothetical protein [Desulfuromonadales bacterium]